MIHFRLPVLPVSGHLAGAVLLAIVLGPAAAIVTMAAILIVQCLLFQDGGLLALGCNIINMGVVPCLLGGWVYRRIAAARHGIPAWRQYLAAWAACMVGITAGAALVPVEAWASGVLQVPPVRFLGVMVGLHLIIAFVEGAITFTVLAALRGMGYLSEAAVRPGPASPGRLPRRVVVATVVATALLLAGVVGWFTGPHADGLESALEGRYYNGTEALAATDGGLAAWADAWQSRWAPMADYTKRHAPMGAVSAEPNREEAAAVYPNLDGWGSLAGVIGTGVTLVLLFGISRLLRRLRRDASCTTAT
ncbi:hypothetical protein LCGC14_2609100, partial [marine sediment metagenome]